MKLPGRFRSFAARLIVIVLCTTVLGWLVFSILLNYELRRQSEEQQVQQLASYADMLWQSLGDEDDMPVLRTTTRTMDAHQVQHQPLAYAVYRSDGRLLATSSMPALPMLATETDSLDKPIDNSIVSSVDFAGEPWIVAARQDGDRQLVVGESRHRQAEIVDEVSEWLGLLAVVSLILLLPLLAWAIHRALKPLRDIGDAIAQRAPDNLEPIDMAVPREIAPLLQRLNILFQRVVATLDRERRFTADASHELRTPLAALSVQLEIAQASPRPEARERALAQMQIGLDRTTRLLAQLLELARLDDTRLPASDSLDRVETNLAELVRHALQEAGLSSDTLLLSVRDPAPCRGHPGLIGLLLRNLLDNARRYAGAAVTIRVEIEGPSLRVIDNGPGVAPDVLARLGERFYRPPGQSQPGAGLGLSIVQRIAELHGAHLGLANREEGGLQVSVDFPVHVYPINGSRTSPLLG